MSSSSPLPLRANARPSVAAGGDAAKIDPQQQAAVEFLSRLLNRNLHIYTNDGRMFAGLFKCTDSDRNIVLASTFEYRLRDPPPAAQDSDEAAVLETPALTADMVPRFMGLVVVPGQYIIKIEVEEGRGYGGM